MKKTFLTLTLCMFSLLGIAESTIGTYQQFGKNFRVESTKPDASGKFTVYLQVGGKHDTDLVYLIIESENLSKWQESLRNIRDKFVDWKSVAQENNVKDMMKNFDISIPSYRVCWKGSKYFFSRERKGDKFTFFVTKAGDIYAVLSEKVSASDNEYLEQTFYMWLTSEEEFNSLIINLDKRHVIEFFQQENKKEDLFK